MNTDYSDIMYHHYKAGWLDQYRGDELIQLLPSSHNDLPITSKNSIIVNPISGYPIGNINLKNRKQRLAILDSISKINHDWCTVFQIVNVDDVFYINPFFQQPNEFFTRKLIKVGNIQKLIKYDILNLNRLMGNGTDNKPHHNSICIKGQIKSTVLSRKCKSFNNPVINPYDFIKSLKESSIGIYF